MKGRTLPEKVLEQLQELGCVQSGMTVCCALSGGADSVCLLRCLLELRQTLGILVTAVHVNHGLRGAESDRDQRFCEMLCADHGISLAVYAVDAAQRAEAEGISVELAARQCRYEAFSQVQADWIATAHTASDNLETLLHRLVRGGGLHGLTSIPPQNGRFLRPMLSVTRNEVEAYLTKLEQSYVTDSTNLSDAYTRNRIRHEIVPAMKRLNPSVERTTCYAIRSLRREDDYLMQQARAAFDNCRRDENTLIGLNTLHPALQMRCLVLFLEQHGLSYDAPLLEHLAGLVQNGGKWSLNRTVSVSVKNGVLSLQNEENMPVSIADEIPFHLGENQLYGGYVLYADLLVDENFVKNGFVHGKFANNCLDYDKIKGNIVLCPRQYGVRVRLPGRNFTSSLKKLVQAAVPPERRATLHTLSDDAGMVFAEYIGAVDRVRPDENTRRLLVLEVAEVSMK